ncbi:MAG TPA: hypothetical protein VKU36_03250 [Candidatus Babeliales bacterium]|nr:hypothetical protein [Candidatus Babeliales bacterium]
MNTFQKVSRLAVVAALSIMTNAYTYFDGMEKVVITTIEKVAANEHVQQAGAFLVVFEGGKLVVKEVVENRNPLAIAVAEGVVVGAVTKNAKAGAAAGITSLGLSTVNNLTQDLPLVKSVKDTINNTLPTFMTSNNAKEVAKFVVAATTGCYFGGVGSKLKSGNPSQK